MVLLGYAGCADALGPPAAIAAAKRTRTARRNAFGICAPGSESDESVARIARRLQEPFCTEIVGQPIEILPQSRGYRDTVPRVLDAFGAALLPGYPDAVDI